ncbi:MAG: hypothetical protein GX859_03380 [Corynebacterium humireducens]|uniref:Uncharacterized protein n=1 Tax=Corynebacterium humireducens TaxID=1223514 RepID=A0A7X6PM23_9CORY|nr:hypothetical protein [Corynebacterium humireducens]
MTQPPRAEYPVPNVYARARRRGRRRGHRLPYHVAVELAPGLIMTLTPAAAYRFANNLVDVAESIERNTP